MKDKIIEFIVVLTIIAVMSFIAIHYQIFN